MRWQKSSSRHNSGTYQHVMNKLNPIFVLALSAGALSFNPSPADANPIARIQEVVSRPAFQQAPGGTEKAAQDGQVLKNKTILRTTKPGRMQVAFAESNRSFRMGGNASLQLVGNTIKHNSGQVIAWITPGGVLQAPLKIRTRIATAAIRGTTLFIDDRGEGDKIIFLSWEGNVDVSADTGEKYSLRSGQVLIYDDKEKAWSGPVALTPEQAMKRRTKSILLNGFKAPMETMPEVEAVLRGAPEKL